MSPLAPPWHLWLSLSLGCHPEDPGTGAPTVPDPEPSWPFSEPQLEGDEILPGNDCGLSLKAAPEGAQIEFLMSRAGMGQGPCDEQSGACASILEPVAVGTATADARGRATLAVPFPEDEPPDIIHFQAKVWDPATGTGTFSSIIERHVNIRARDAASELVERTIEAGIDVFTFGNSHTGGVAWIDYNGDLWPDLFVANGGGEEQRLFRNEGDGTFSDVSFLVPKPDVSLESAAAHFADIENDGDVDLLVVVDTTYPMDTELPMPYEGGPNLLYVNQGDGTFREEAGPRGIVDPRGWRNITGAFADFDADGFIDVHIGHWSLNQPELDSYGRLLFNDGTGRFQDTGQKLGYGRDSLTTLAADLNGDGWTDLYLGNVNGVLDFVGKNPVADDVLYLNDHGVLYDATSPGMGDEAWAAMGLDVGDLDNDGDFDLYEADRWDVPDPLPQGNPLYINQGDGTFADNSCDEAGICTGYSCWAINFADFDRDGWTDLFVGTTKSWYIDLLYMNNRDGTFYSHFVPGFRDNAIRGGAIADYDADGDVDVFVWNLGYDAQLYATEPRDSHHWVELKLIGTRSNREAIGAVIKLTTADGMTQMRRVSGGDSAHSQSEAIVHFGVGEQSAPVELEIVWPGGEVQRVEDIPTDRLSLVDQDRGFVPDELTHAVAWWSSLRGGVLVVAQTSYRGRSSLWMDSPPTPAGEQVTHTDLVWDAATQQYEAFVPLRRQPPERVDVHPRDGASWTLPVLTLD
jgi:hypothetical protein